MTSTPTPTLTTMLALDASAPAPLFEQIRTQIAERRASGELPAGHRLPPVRTLAADLGLAPNTVARAFRELEASGVIETRGRSGSFVSGTRESSRRAAAAAAREYVRRVRALGLSDADAAELVREACGREGSPSSEGGSPAPPAGVRGGDPSTLPG